MSTLLRDDSVAWAALMVLVLPVLIIGAGEVEERLRQRDSPFGSAVAIVRTWVVPLFAIWVLARALLDLDDDGPFLRIVATAMFVAIGLAVLAALRVVVVRLRDRPRSEGRAPIPRLVLAMPRIGVVLALAWILLAGVWAVDLSAALTALGVTSLVVSFALQDTLSGLASGFTLLADQPFQPGDWVAVEELEGRVVDINWRSTRLQTRDGDLVVVPNGKLAGATITNYDEPARAHRIVVSLQVAYSNPPTAAKEMLLDAARSTPGVLAEPAPQVMVVQIDDPLMGYDVHLWVDDYAIVPQVKSDFGSLVWYHSHRHGVPLPSPAQDLYLHDAAQLAADSVVTPAQRRERILRSELLASLDDDQLDRLASDSVLAKFARDEVVVVEGTTTGLHVLADGTTRLLWRSDGHDDVEVAHLGPGDVFGIMGRTRDEAGRAVVVAVDDCEVVAISPQASSQVASTTPMLSQAIEQLAGDRRRRIERILRRRALAGSSVSGVGELDRSGRPLEEDEV